MEVLTPLFLSAINAPRRQGELRHLPQEKVPWGALVLSIMEMYVNGVSTRKVKRVTEALCGVTFSSATVSNLCTALDAQVAAFNERKLDGDFPFLIVDCMFIKAREDKSIQSKACMIVCGINQAGEREIVGLRMVDSESESFWRDTFDWLKGRGLKGVELVVSDHKGLMNAASKGQRGNDVRCT